MGVRNLQLMYISSKKMQTDTGTLQF